MNNNNFVDISIRVPAELYDGLVNMSATNKTDLNADLVNLFECYLGTWRRMLREPSANILVGVSK